MELVPKSVLLPPAVCILCEQSPVDDEPLVDTNATLVTGFPFSLEGRKYVCEGCARAVGEAFGLVADEVEKAAVERAERAEAKLAAVSGFLTGFAEEVVAGKLDEIAKYEGVPAPVVPYEEQKSGLEAAVEAGTDPGQVNLAETAPEPDAQPVPAAQVDEPVELTKEQLKAAAKAEKDAAAAAKTEAERVLAERDKNAPVPAAALDTIHEATGEEQRAAAEEAAPDTEASQ